MRRNQPWEDVGKVLQQWEQHVQSPEVGQGSEHWGISEGSSKTVARVEGEGLYRRV